MSDLIITVASDDLIHFTHDGKDENPDGPERTFLVTKPGQPDQRVKVEYDRGWTLTISLPEGATVEVLR